MTTVEEIIEIIRKEASQIDNAKIYYTLKQLRLHNISETQIQIVKIFVAARKLGLSICSTTLIKAFFQQESQSLLTTLHLLGDKGILTIIKNIKGGPLRYMLSERFMNVWEPQAKPQNINT